MPHEHDQKGPGWIFWAAISFVFLILHTRSASGQPPGLLDGDLIPGWFLESLRYLYMPLVWFTESYPWAADAFDGYADFWRS